jgi:hypothetical protein
MLDTFFRRRARRALRFGAVRGRVRGREAFRFGRLVRGLRRFRAAFCAFVPKMRICFADILRFARLRRFRRLPFTSSVLRPTVAMFVSCSKTARQNKSGLPVDFSTDKPLRSLFCRLLQRRVHEARRN